MSRHHMLKFSKKKNILQKVNTNGSKNNPVKEEYYEDKKKIYTN